MVCFKQFWREQPAAVLGDAATVTGMISHPEVSATPTNALLGIGGARGGYHRCHGTLMGGAGAFTVRDAGAWPLRGTGLKDGDEFGGAHRVVGYECDGLDCCWQVTAP